jgi:hypothetical protein
MIDERVEHAWNEECLRKTKLLSPIVTLSTKNSTWIDFELNPGLHGEKQPELCHGLSIPHINECINKLIN